MSNYGHTSGPWGLHPRVKVDPPEIYHDGCIVATVNTSAPDPGEREANANLIAAAPDLLAACRDALAIRQTSYCVDANTKMNLPERKDMQNELRLIQSRIESAIAKAEGRAS